jgi:hypothetical protein
MRPQEEEEQPVGGLDVALGLSGRGLAHIDDGGPPEVGGPDLWLWGRWPGLRHCFAHRQYALVERAVEFGWAR